jgi:hypothetical protein
LPFLFDSVKLGPEWILEELSLRTWSAQIALFPPTVVFEAQCWVSLEHARQGVALSRQGALEDAINIGGEFLRVALKVALRVWQHLRYWLTLLGKSRSKKAEGC